MSLPQPGTSEPPIQLSAAAIAEIRRLQTCQTEATSPRVRLNLAPGGCEDFLYDLKFDPNPWDGDRLYLYQDIEFVIHTDILSKIQGLQLDYSEDLMGGGFRFHNPNAAKNCGCGNSFSVR
jgi:iron-sulfur cluster assembly protein